MNFKTWNFVSYTIIHSSSWSETLFYEAPCTSYRVQKFKSNAPPKNKEEKRYTFPQCWSFLLSEIKCRYNMWSPAGCWTKRNMGGLVQQKSLNKTYLPLKARVTCKGLSEFKTRQCSSPKCIHCNKISINHFSFITFITEGWILSPALFSVCILHQLRVMRSRQTLLALV